MQQPQNYFQVNAVVVEFVDGKWVVKVTENQRVFEQEFGMEAHAISYADGQRMRLGIYRP